MKLQVKNELFIKHMTANLKQIFAILISTFKNDFDVKIEMVSCQNKRLTFLFK